MANKNEAPPRSRQAHASPDEPNGPIASGSTSGLDGLPVNYRCVPDTLRALPHWIVWKFFKNPRTQKLAKVPCDTAGNKTDATDFSNGVSFELACEALQRNPTLNGLGFLLGKGIAGIDVDHCIDPLGELNERGRRISEQTRDTYAEVSPSGRGFKVLIDIGDDEKLAVIGKNTAELEVYGSRRFFTITGELLAGHPSIIARKPDVFREIAESVGGDMKFLARDERVSGANSSLGLSRKDIVSILEHLPSEWSDNYGEWIKAGMAIHHETGGSAEGYEIYETFSRLSPKYVEGEPADKFHTFGKSDGVPVTMRTLIRAAEANGWRAPASIAEAMREFGGDADVIESTTGRLRLYNPLREPPKRIRYMLGAPVFLPDLAEQVTFFGRSDAFKSVSVQAFCVYMAAGVSLDGKAVAPRVVVYAAEEAPLLWDNNMHGWVQHFAKIFEPSVCAHAMKNLSAGYLQRIDRNIGGLKEDRAQELADLVLHQMQTLDSEARPVVVLDPIFEVMEGDENSSSDMRNYIAAGRLIQRVAGALVVHVHHTGHSATDRERGSSSLPASQFVRYQLRRENRTAYEVELHCVKHKAGAARTPSRWRVHMVELMPQASDADTEPLTAVVLELLGDAPPIVTKGDVLAEKEADDMARLVQAYRRDSTVGRPHLAAKLGYGNAKVDKLRERAVEQGLLARGGGAGRAGYSLTDAGCSLADRTMVSGEEEDDPLG